MEIDSRGNIIDQNGNRVPFMEIKITEFPESMNGQVSTEEVVGTEIFLRKYFSESMRIRNVSYTKISKMGRRKILTKKIMAEGAVDTYRALMAQVTIRERSTEPEEIRTREIYEIDAKWIKDSYKKKKKIE